MLPSVWRTDIEAVSASVPRALGKPGGVVSGEMMYVAPSVHSCEGPPAYPPHSYKRIAYPIGSIWRCECGQYFRHCFIGSTDTRHWKRIGRRRAERILRKVGKS